MLDKQHERPLLVTLNEQIKRSETLESGFETRKSERKNQQIDCYFEQCR